MPRITHISTMTRWGGVERMLVDMLTKIQPSPFDHSLLCTSSHQDLLAPVLAANVPVFEPRRRFHYDPTAIKQMATWLRSNKTDVVHVYNSTASTWGGVAARLAQTPALVGGEHGTVWSVRPPYFFFNRWAYQQAKVVVANSEASRLMINHRFGIPLEKVKVVYNAVPSFSAAGLHKQDAVAQFASRSRLVVGSVGRLTPQKDFMTLVEAAALILAQRKDISFILVGGGEEEKALKKRLQELGIEDHFLLTGWRADARSLIPLFDVFISTSLFEPFGNVLIEAALAGKPVIAPAVDGIPEAVINGQTGLLIEPTAALAQDMYAQANLPEKVVIAGSFSPPRALDPARLAQAILSLSDNLGLRAEYGDNGRRRAREIFGVHRYQRELEAVYAAVI